MVDGSHAPLMASSIEESGTVETTQTAGDNGWTPLVR
jgi:hypothetical protein